MSKLRPTARPLRPAVFIDKDGTLVHDVPYNVDPAKLRFTEGAIDALRRLVGGGFPLIVVSNQPGIALGRFDSIHLQQFIWVMGDRLAEGGAPITGFYACPHAPATGPVASCLCRKPAAGLFYQAARVHGIDLSRSWMIGDILDDVEAGRRAGCRTVLLDVGHETVWRQPPERRPHHRVSDLLQAAELILASPQRRAAPVVGADGTTFPALQ